MEVLTGQVVQEVKKAEAGNGYTAVVHSKADSRVREFTAEKVLLAAGRRSNADLLQVERTDVELDQRGYIKVNDYMQSSNRHIYAVGDANGQQMFTHVANREAMVAADHVLHGARIKMDYSSAPHAVYSYPQIASVGLTEEKAGDGHKVRVGKTRYSSLAYGLAMKEKEGFAKAIIEDGTERILGFHIIGPYAPLLIQEVINAMSSKGDAREVFAGMHIHPALSELVPTTLGSV